MPSVRALVVLLASLALLAAGAVGCGDGDGGTRTLNVSAAVSLIDAFEALGHDFEDRHPDIEVVFNFGASSGLAEQIAQGAPVDVFASADETTMARVADAGDVHEPVVFARNRLSIVVEPGNPRGIRSLADLAAGGVVALCAPDVPCGRYAAAALDRAGVTLKPTTLEEHARAVVSKVTLGEADAGVVYATDVLAAGDDVEGVEIDVADEPDLEAVYPMAVAAEARLPGTAAAWVEFVRSEEGRRTLERFGFLAP